MASCSARNVRTAFFMKQTAKTRIPTLVEPDPTDQFFEARIVSQGIKEGMNLNVCQKVSSFLRGPIQPDKCLFLIAEPQICVHKGARGNVAGLLTLLHFAEEPKCICASPSLCVCHDKHTEGVDGGFGIRDNLFQRRDRFIGLAVGNQRHPKEHVGRMVRFHR